MWYGKKWKRNSLSSNQPTYFQGLSDCLSFLISDLSKYLVAKLELSPFFIESNQLFVKINPDLMMMGNEGR